MAAVAQEPRRSAQEPRQLRLDERWEGARQPQTSRTGTLCAGCRARDARYGFQEEGAIRLDHVARPRTLCFECFRIEIDRRHRLAAHLARGWNAEPVKLPLSETLNALERRRRRAQIAARHALGA